MGALIGVLGVGAFCAAQAPAAIPSMSVNFGTNGGSDDVSKSLQILVLLTVLSLAPAILMLTTAFTRIVIILGFLRTALGTPTIPPNQVVIGLSLFLTFYVMGPTYQEINKVALQPLSAGEIGFWVAVDKAQEPAKAFMLKNTYDRDLQLFLSLQEGQPAPKNATEVPITVVIPAFIISELKTAFIIGFYLFIPFLIIDLIVASALMGMGMMMLPPTVVSLPAKLLVFVLADGWGVLVQAILAGYR